MEPISLPPAYVLDATCAAAWLLIAHRRGARGECLS
jgi:hypothetical protein